MNRTTAGMGLALVTALISGLAIFLNSYAVKQIADAALFTTLKNGVAAVVLLGLAAAVVRRGELRRVDRRSWLGVAVVGVFGGGLAFLLFFSGLALASAPTAAFTHKTLFVWVALLAVPLLGERLGLLQVGALAGLLLSQLLVAPPTGLRWGSGETLIALATLLWAGEVIVARRLLTRVPVAVLAVGRLAIGLVVLAGYLVVSGRVGLLAELGATQWAWVIGSGVLLAGYVASWFAALARAPATVVTSVLVIGAPITALLTALSGGGLPAPVQLLGLGLVPVAALVMAAASLLRGRRLGEPAMAG
jgi:drug/metabolite transporter (DMT)-like permease